MNEEIAAQIQRVIQARRIAAEHAEVWTELQAIFRETHVEYADSAKRAAEACTAEEATLHELALQEYERTKNKQIAPGIGIRVMQRLNYDPREALKWAIEHTMALQLDKERFKQIASVEELTFVTKQYEPIATISPTLKEAE